MRTLLAVVNDVLDISKIEANKMEVFAETFDVAAMVRDVASTVGSLVAYGGLGNLIKDGVLTNFRAELFTASLLCVVLAFVLDALLVLAQRMLTPWTRGVRA